MIHTILFLPGLSVGGAAISVNYPNEPVRLDGALSVDVPLASMPRLDLRVFGTVAERYSAQPRAEDPAFLLETDLVGEVGPQWRFGKPPLVGACDFGFGLTGTVVSPGAGVGATATGFATHTGAIAEVGSGPTRLTLAVRLSGAFSGNYTSGTSYSASGSAGWNYAGADVRLAAGIGVAFGAPHGATP